MAYSMNNAVFKSHGIAVRRYKKNSRGSGMNVIVLECNQIQLSMVGNRFRFSNHSCTKISKTLSYIIQLYEDFKEWLGSYCRDLVRVNPKFAIVAHLLVAKENNNHGTCS